MRCHPLLIVPGLALPALRVRGGQGSPAKAGAAETGPANWEVRRLGAAPSEVAELTVLPLR